MSLCSKEKLSCLNINGVNVIAITTILLLLLLFSSINHKNFRLYFVLFALCLCYLWGCDFVMWCVLCMHKSKSHLTTSKCMKCYILTHLFSSSFDMYTNVAKCVR